MKLGSWLLGGFIGCLIAISCIFPSYATKTEMNDAKKKAGSMEEEKKELETTLKQLDQLKSNVAKYVEKLDVELNSLNKQLSALNSQISTKEEERAIAQSDLEVAKNLEKKQYRDMKLRIQYMYEKGETNYLDLLFRSQDLTQLFNRVEYIRSIAAYDRKMLEEFKRSKEEVKKREAVLEKEHKKLMELRLSAEEKKGDMERLLVAKNNELSGYEIRIDKGKDHLSTLEKDIAAQEQKMKEIEALIKKKEEEAQKAAQQAGKRYNTVGIGNINLEWPCPSSSRITSGFGDRESPTEGASSNHQGIDIGAAVGVNIIASASGTVTISTYSYSAGNYIMIHHGGGIYTVYMHSSERLVSAGDEVSQGQVIAKVGSTGYSTGSHLHFGIRVNGIYVNPMNYVSP
ncbi:M23 family metallopeptidase [Clostridium sp. E02]|uniref:murein hydrolase activator EnvC family protein n=1 Tax=Clostridium sp. E02 TaxID=2487134 RepID=UPI000F532F55|nr:M23 family metallopeptidase [Clostridium sp. E02]